MLHYMENRLVSLPQKALRCSRCRSPLNRNIRDPYISFLVADVDLPQPMAPVSAWGEHFKSKLASRCLGLVRITSMQAKLNSCAAQLSWSDCATHRVVLEGMVSVQHPLRAIPGAD